jgi:hypothetical protein
LKSLNAIKEVFAEYEKLTNRSGLELNADKTEILIMNTNTTATIHFQYLGTQYNINSVEKIKI